MGRPPRRLPDIGPPAQPSPLVDDVLRAIDVILAPLIRLLLVSGADYPRIAAELKPLFVEQARLELIRAGQKDTDSALSLLSGVHRKDVRAWRQGRLTGRTARGVSISSQVFARWVQDPLYRDRRKRPRPLPRLGSAPSFEALSRSITQDVHPYTVLSELMRLGLVQVQDVQGHETIVPLREGFVPAVGSPEMMELFGGNLSDHAAAAVANLLVQAPRLEQSVFAVGITAESAQHLGGLARKLWAQAKSEMIAEATRRYEADQTREDATSRMRFGAYYWSDDSASEHQSAASAERGVVREVE